MRRVYWAAFIGAVACVVGHGRSSVVAADHNLTLENAPAIMRQMALSIEEFQSILNEKEKQYVHYIPGDSTCAGLVDRRMGQADGRLFVWGQWNRVGKGSTGPLDLQYRPAPSAAAGNPSYAHSNMALRTAPPEPLQPRPTPPGREPFRRIDLQIRGSINSTFSQPENFRRDMEQSADMAAKSVESTAHLKDKYVADLGFGLDRNDMYVHLPKPDYTAGTCQVIIKLADRKKCATVQVQLFSCGQATSNQRAMLIAKNAAAIVARKVFGVDARVERSGGEAGILDAYLARSLGRTPMEDVRENKHRLGEPFILAVVYRPTQPNTRVLISAKMRPGPDALAASESRAALIKPGLRKWHPPRPLSGEKTYHEHVACIDPRGRIDDEYSWHSEIPDSHLEIRPYDGDTQVLYITIPTGRTDNLDKFFLGIGRWDIELSMKEFRGSEAAFKKSGGSGDTAEVSTEKISLLIQDDREAASRYLDLPAESPRGIP